MHPRTQSPSHKALPNTSSGSLSISSRSAASQKNSLGSLSLRQRSDLNLGSAKVSPSSSTTMAVKENLIKREQRRQSRENLKLTPTQSSQSHSYSYSSGSIPSSASIVSPQRKILGYVASKPPSSGVVGTSFRSASSRPITTTSSAMKTSRPSLTQTSAETNKASSSSQNSLQNGTLSTATRSRKPSIFTALKINTSNSLSLSSARPPSSTPSSSSTAKGSEDALTPAGSPMRAPSSASKRLSLKEAFMDKFSPRSFRGKRDLSPSMDNNPSNNDPTNESNVLTSTREKNESSQERRSSVATSTSLSRNTARGLSGTSDPSAIDYYNPVRENPGFSSVHGTRRNSVAATHVYVDRSHLVFDAPTAPLLLSSSARQVNGNTALNSAATSAANAANFSRLSNSSSRMSIATRRGSLHPDVDEILRMGVPKRSSALKYQFNKQPNRPRGLIGLANLGNTCFMNSILQCIFATELLMGYFVCGDFQADLNFKSPMKGQLANAFAQIVENALDKSAHSKALSPARFKKQIEMWAPQFAGYNQQDAQEFLRFMLDGLHEDLNRVKLRPKFGYRDADVDRLSDADKARFSWHRYHASNSSFVFDLFGGQLQSTVTCHSCNYPSTTFETFWDLSLPIPKSSIGTAASKCTLTDCLQEFAAKEVLDEPYRCDNCKQKVSASKRLQIHKCPEILVLHLKRFAYSRRSRDKIETSIAFPLRKLSLEPIMTDTPGHDQIVYYDLYGVSSHMGGLGGGHYIAHARNWDTGCWYEKNDGFVSEVDEGRVADGLERTCYVLFFQKSR